MNRFSFFVQILLPFGRANPEPPAGGATVWTLRGDADFATTRQDNPISNLSGRKARTGAGKQKLRKRWTGCRLPFFRFPAGAIAATCAAPDSPEDSKKMRKNTKDAQAFRW